MCIPQEAFLLLLIGIILLPAALWSVVSMRQDDEARQQICEGCIQCRTKLQEQREDARRNRENLWKK